MSHANKAASSFFIVPSEKRDYKSSIKLGNVLYNLQQPHLVLFRPDKAAPAPLLVEDIADPKTLNNYVIGKDDSSNTKVGLFAKILEFFGAGGELSHQSDKDASERYTVKSITFGLLDPSPAFHEVLKGQPAIISHLEDGSPPHAFLVTGVVSATGVVFESTSTTDRANEASLGVNVHGAPLGFMGRRSKKRKLRIEWEDPGPTVLAYKVQKLRLKEGQLTAEDEKKGAFFGDDDEEPTRPELEYSDTLDQRDVEGLENEVGEDELVGGGFSLYVPDE